MGGGVGMPGPRGGNTIGACGPIGCGCGCGARTTGVFTRSDGGGVHVGFAAGARWFGATPIAEFGCLPIQIGMLVGVGDGAVDALTLTPTGAECPSESLTVIVVLPFPTAITVN